VKNRASDNNATLGGGGPARRKLRGEAHMKERKGRRWRKA
jgi:hypothetical protein